MANFTYPSRDIDRPALLLSYLGSHWQSVYGGQQQIRTIVQARGRVANQTAIDLREAVDAVSRLTVPVYHTDHWYRLVLRESARNAGVTAPIYGDGWVYGNQPETGVILKYGSPEGLFSSFAIDSDIRDVRYVFNRLTSPSLTYVKNLDFTIADGVITFRENPFNNPLVAIRQIYEGSEVVDREIALWLFRAQVDVGDIYEQHAFPIKLQLPSSERYRDFVNAVRDGVTEGGAGKHLVLGFEALTDTPVVASDGEVVEYIVTDERHLLIITDKQAYKFPTGAVPIVEVGDIVDQYDQLVDTVRFIEFHNGTVPDDLISIELGKGLLPAGYMGGISWRNKRVPVVVDDNGIFTRVEWELGGFPGDITKFWDDFHSNGVLNPPTLAQLLDQRTNKAGEPGPGALPTSINPLEFLAQNVLRHHAFVVKVKLTQFGDAALGIKHARHLRRIIPPHTHMILVVELAVDNETITMEGAGDELTPGYEEAPILQPALEPIEETIDGSAFITTGTPTLSYTEGQCI